MRVALALVLLCAVASADPATDLLTRIEKGDKGSIAELDKLAAQNVDAIGAFLARKHTADVSQRRKVLEAIKALVPDKNGRFVTPERKSAKEEKADDDLDWLTGLQGLTDMTGLGEVIADDVAIRALAKTHDVKAASILFTTAFADETTIYRDELGRYIRKMEPYSIPALIVESVDKNADKKRYATWQLERLDRQEPQKALAAANGDEALTIAILSAYETTHYREAVHAVWTKVDADSPRVRATARKTWDAYITGPPPPPAPKKKLQLAGGKLTKKEKPLWLTYRELADNELRKASNELLHTDLKIVDPSLDDHDDDDRKKKKNDDVVLVDLTKQLYAYYDGERTKHEGEAWTAAKAQADKGDLASAATGIDRLLARNPDGGDKAAMATIYFNWGKELEKQNKFGDAAVAYSKAAGLDPKGPHGTDALAAHHYMLGKSLEKDGKDGGPDFRRAVALRPDYGPAKAAAVRAENGGKPTWMLYAAGSALVVALALFGVAMSRRRA